MNTPDPNAPPPLCVLLRDHSYKPGGGPRHWLIAPTLPELLDLAAKTTGQPLHITRETRASATYTTARNTHSITINTTKPSAHTIGDPRAQAAAHRPRP